MPWGDYGDVLFAGFAYPDEKDETRILIERAGSFVPPVYCFSRYLLISDTLKLKLEQSDLTGFGYQKTIFHKIVAIDWMKWDLNAEEAKFYPRSGEPEDYILKRKHHPEIAEKMEQIWCLMLDNKTLTGRISRDVSSKNELFIIENSWTGNDIFITEGAGYIFFSEKAKLWFENNAGEYANFEQFNSKFATQDEIDFAIEYITPKPIKVSPFAHLTVQDWQGYQKYLRHASKFIAKSLVDKTDKSRATSIRKAIESFKNAEQIRPLGKKEQALLNKISREND